MKKFLIILAVIVGILLCIFHNEINTIMFVLTNGDAPKIVEKMKTASPEEAEKLAEKIVQLKFLGHTFETPTMIITDACNNPNPEVLKAVLDNKKIKTALKEESKDNSNVNLVTFVYVVNTKNAPDKVKILLEHGYDPYKVNSNNRNAMNALQERYYQIDPKVFDVINKYYSYK